MSKNCVACLIVCAVLLIGTIWLCGCGKASYSEEKNPSVYIIVTYPNSSEIYVEGYGKISAYRDSTMSRVEIDEVVYWTGVENVLVKKDSH